MSDSLIMKNQNRIHLATFFIGLLLSSGASAKVENLWVWQPDPNSSIRYVMPKLKGEALSELSARWQTALKKSKTYGKMENVSHVNLETSAKTFSPLPPSTAENANVAVVLNRPNQMTDKSPYLKTVIKSFEAEGNHLFAIPVGLENVLSPKEMDEFRSKLNSFDGQLGIGGDDPHPKSYSQKSVKETRGDISFKRDIQQSKYMTEYIANGKGRVYYVCGSEQRLGIADGRAFHTDIADVTEVAQRGLNGPVLLEVTAEEGSELALAAGSTRFQTSNYHHAAVHATEVQKGRKPETKITAYNIEADGTRGQLVKAIELPKNAGFATQFHPEFRGSPEENNIVRYVSTGWKMRGRYAPKDVVNCMSKSLRSLDLGSGSAP